VLPSHFVYRPSLLPHYCCLHYFLPFLSYVLSFSHVVVASPRLTHLRSIGQSLLCIILSRERILPVLMFVVWFPASLVWKQPATTTQRISSYHWTTTKWICLKIKRQSSPNHHTVRFPLRMMNSENKTRPRYLQELPLIPIDEIYSKSFRWNRIGCYALYNGDQALCYVGYTKNLQRKIAFHAKLQPDNCKFFKAFVVENPKVSAAYLEKILDAWLLEYGSVPPGNSTQRHLWEGRKVTCVCVFFVLWLSEPRLGKL